MVMSVLLSTGKAFCEATTVQASYTLVQSTVAVEKTTSLESGNIDPTLGGKATTLTSSFNLQANNESTFFIVYSNVQVEGGQKMSAFDSAGNLLFANTTYLPTETDINNAKIGNSANANVIVYPFSLSGENIETTYTSSEDYENCYKVTLTDPLVKGVLNQTVGGMPVVNTYSTRDKSGIYSATVYVTAATEI